MAGSIDGFNAHAANLVTAIYHKSGRAMWFAKCLEETSLQCYILLLKSVVTKAE